MDSKKKFQELKDRREAYFPLLRRFLRLHKVFSKDAFPVKISKGEEIMLLIELKDLGYIDKETFYFDNKKGDFVEAFYSGDYPLTEKGFNNYQLYYRTKKIQLLKKLSIAVIILIMCLVALIFF